MRDMEDISNMRGIIKPMQDFEFIDAMGRNTNFSRKGLFALYDYLNDLSEEKEEPIRFNKLDIEMEFSEYSSATEGCEDVGALDEIVEYLDEDANPEEIEEACKEHFRDEGLLLEFDGGVIIRNF